MKIYRYKITISTPEHYNNSKIKTKELGEENRPQNDYKTANIVFDDVLVSWKAKYINQFFIRRGQNKLDIEYLSHSRFDLAKKTKRDNINNVYLFNQTLRDIEILYRDFGRLDKKYIEFKYLCKYLGKTKIINYILIDLKKDEGLVCFFENRNTWFEYFPETTLMIFSNFKGCKAPFWTFQVQWMLYAIKEDLEKLDELVSLQNQVKYLRIQGKLGKQNFHENMKKVFEPVTILLKMSPKK